MYRVQQFASLAGVTVRTLHHYDRLGLLTPADRTGSGYRLYRTEDLIQLERIVVLRYLGLSLRQIADLFTAVKQDRTSLAETLATQAIILRDRRDGIARVLRAVEAAGKSLSAAQVPDWDLFKTILQEVNMQTASDWSKKYYSDSAQQAVEQHKTQWSPELQAKVTAEWQQMYADIDSALARNVEPTSAEGKAIARRWMDLVGVFTQGNPEVLQGLNSLYADRANWPVTEPQANLPKPDYMAFIQAANAS